MWYIQSLLMLFILVSSCTLIGRHFCLLLPWRLRPLCKLYLSPCLGLALLMFFSILTGWAIGFSSGLYIRLIMLAIIITAFYLEREKRVLCNHLAVVNIFTFIASLPVLFCLLRYDAYYPFNDTFTYLMHGQWLQSHAFSESVQVSGFHPALTQISGYQEGGFRMGASFFLGWIQSLFGAQWSYRVYPVAIAIPLAMGSFAVGYCASLCGFHRRRDGILIGLFTAASLCGLTFGSLTGFLPQTYGLAFGVSFLGLIGNVLIRAVHLQKWQDGISWTIPSAILFSAVVYSYSELVPFITIACMLAGSFFLFYAHSSKNIFLISIYFIFQSLILLNREIYRAVKAILIQSKTIVGGAVDWSIIDFIGYAFGIRAGSWNREAWFFNSQWFSLILLLFVLAWLVLSFKRIFSKRALALLPCAFYIFVSILAFLYFRYAVDSPWHIGMGQTWSQCKITSWMGPFCLVFVGISVLFMLRHFRRYSSIVLCGLLLCLMVGTVQNGAIANHLIKPFLRETGCQRSSFEAFLNLRHLVKDTVESEQKIYLDLGGTHHKMRQMVAYFLWDFDLSGNWSDDGYLSDSLPPGERKIPLSISDYMITFKDSSLAQKGTERFGNLVFLKTPS